MEDESLELLRVVAEGSVQGFLETLAGPLVETGEWGRDLVRRRRFKTQLKTLTLAREMLSDAGIAPSAVSLKILAPLLEGAANEGSDSDEMIRRWAALLANAAASDAGPHVLPSFPTLLAEISSSEALVLDAFYRDLSVGRKLQEDEIGDFQGGLGFDDDGTFEACVFNLDRLGLITSRVESGMVRGRWRVYPYYMGTRAIGTLFVAACRPPTAR